MSEQPAERPEERPATTTAPMTTPRGPAENRGIRVGTVVWGLVVIAVALGLLAIGNGLVFDVQLAVILLVAGAGLAVLVGSLLGARRRAS
ncbi:hypothetical protein Q6348_00285 [Isoptericola sp. b441]|uniref:DUF2530 domain-containing protein n=1 Tax=Actinotalea lenta TaxID=3064654 RepID=A0ABT9D4R5_9CELL|nr:MULTISPECIES: hypothetical protein [unclassified Isoptericola]MDO8105633.1 hypothetical protein [Isoptericola sp. b441]MDO8122337.1 hypothetical protein [Isoptericola sp. b490]